MKTHTSKVDNWFRVVVLIIALLPLLFGLLEGILILPSLIICGVIVGFMLWLYMATKYFITDEMLIVHGGVFKVNIPRSSITSITDSRSALSSPAFSLDRFEIIYGEGKMILISPKDKSRFLEDLNWQTP